MNNAISGNVDELVEKFKTACGKLTDKTNVTESKTLDELITRIEIFKDIKIDVGCIVDDISKAAIKRFLEEHHLDKTVLHKKSQKKGVFEIAPDLNYDGFQLKFYPLKKDGKVSVNTSIDYQVWWYANDYRKNFEEVLDNYEPCEENEA